MSVIGWLREQLGSEPSGPDLPEIPVATPVALDVLKNDRRRLIIHEVAEAARDGDTTTVSDVAESMTVAEQDCDPGEYTSKERKRCYVSTYQTHVPKLDSEGIVEVDDPNAPTELRATDITEAMDHWAWILEGHFVGDETTAVQEHTDFEALREEAMTA